MQRYKLRLLVALLTFCIGLFVVKTIQLLENAIVQRFYTVHDTDISSITVPTNSLDSNEIYNVILREKFLGPDVNLLVVDSESSSDVMNEIENLKMHSGHEGPYSKMVQSFMPEAQTETLDNFVAVNQTSGPLTISAPDLNMVMVSTPDLSLENLGVFWSTFQKTYPNSSGLIWFSHVGFNNRHDQAFVYVSYNCGGLCGAGGYVLLRKRNSRWLILRDEVVWIS